MYALIQFKRHEADVSIQEEFSRRLDNACLEFPLTTIKSEQNKEVNLINSSEHTASS